MKNQSPSAEWPTEGFDEAELSSPSVLTLPRLVWRALPGFLRERPGQIIGSTFILLMLWGTHGKMELLGLVWSSWRGPGTGIGSRPQLLPGIPWDNELISFWTGALLLVVVPILLIRFVYRQPLSAFGLGIPPRGRRALALWTFVLLTVVSLPGFWAGALDHGMRQVYPLYKPFASPVDFLLYELAYFPFFVAIEFIFRGYLLFGLARVRDTETGGAGAGAPGVFFFAKYALLIQMLSYTAWHLGKPVPEVWGTLVWGLAAGVAAFAVRSIWPVVFAHWLLNVFMDAVIAKPF